MSENYLDFFIHNYELDIGIFYSSKYEIGNYIENIYQTKYCDLDVEFDLSNLEIENCSEFF